MNQYQQKGLLVLVGLVTFFVSLAFGGGAEVEGFRYLALIAVCLSGVLALFDRYLWRWRVFYDWLVPAPDLNGNWSGSGVEIVMDAGRPGGWVPKKEELLAENASIQQSFSDIHLIVHWADGSTSALKQPAGYLVSGRRIKTLTFSGVYDLWRAGEIARPRNIIATATVQATMFRNRPSSLELTYFAGDQQGILNLERQTE